MARHASVFFRKNPAGPAPYKAISALRDFKEISARNVGIVFLVFDSAGGKIECREMRREQRNVTAVDFLEELVMVLSEILMPPSATFLF